MLDVFGSVFGRSKKESKSAQNGGQQQQQQPSPSTSRRDGGSGSEGEADGFTVLNPQSPPSSVMYPMILTDEMLRSPPSSSTNPVVATGTTTNPSASSSTAMNNVNHDVPTTSHDRFNSMSTPMDNVPFVPNGFYSSGNASRSTDNLGRCLSTIDRVGHFINSADYNFSLERGVLRE